MRKRGKVRGNGPAHRMGARTTEMLPESELIRLKHLVLQRHHEWRRPKRRSYPFYLLVILLIFAGIYVIISPPFPLSPLGMMVTLVITNLLIAGLLLALAYRYKERSRESMEDLIESEIIRLKHERLARV